MAKFPIPKPKAAKAATKMKLPAAKTAATPAPKLPTTGIKGYLATSGSKVFSSPKPAKNGLAAVD